MECTRVETNFAGRNRLTAHRRGRNARLIVTVTKPLRVAAYVFGGLIIPLRSSGMALAAERSRNALTTAVRESELRR